MVRKEDSKILKRLKEAKTPKEIVDSWAAQAPGRDMSNVAKSLNLFMERRPDMIEDFAGNIVCRYVESGQLDAKTRCLVLIGICMAMGVQGGIVAQVQNAKGAGCTEEEIMDVAYLACYQAGKAMLCLASSTLEEAFQSTKNIKKYEYDKDEG